jgi:outer membrane lipoprotein-sorting protein
MNSRILFLFVFLALGLSLSSCMPLRPETDPLMDQKALALANGARSYNRDTVASRGKGWAKLETPTKTERYRIAWAAVSPNKARITFLLSGNPVETIISTGKDVHFVSHTGKHGLYTRNSEDPDMGDYLEVPVKMSEIISILLGRFPLKGFDDAYFSLSDASQATLVTRQKDQNGLQHLTLDGHGNINRIQYLDIYGAPLYEILFLDYKAHDSHDIPVKLRIKDNENRMLTLDITDFEPNPPIKDSVFQLTDEVK